MMSLTRNKETIYFALYEGMGEQTVDGLYTGVPIPQYGSPYSIKASVSAARGTADVDLFGVNTSYSRVVIVDDMTCPIDEHTRLWIGRGTDQPHNYEVVQVARSLNHISYAVTQVDYSNEGNA